MINFDMGHFWVTIEEEEEEEVIVYGREKESKEVSVR